MQVNPANVPLPTPSTDSDMLPPDQPMPASPRTHTFVDHLQGQIVHQATTRERGRTTTRATQDLCNALADFFFFFELIYVCLRVQNPMWHFSHVQILQYLYAL